MLRSILGISHVNNKNETIDIYKNENMIYGVYFSASWCRPCVYFTN